MKQKTNKYFYLILSFIVLTLSVSVFAQEVKLTKPLPDESVFDLGKKIDNVRDMLATLKTDYINNLSNCKIKEMTYQTRYFWDDIGIAQERVEKLSKAYAPLFDEVYSYTDYLFQEMEKTALERATQRYLDTPKISIKNYHLEEEAIFQKMQKLLESLEKAWFREYSFKKVVKIAKQQEPVINDLISALDDRLKNLKVIAERNINRNTEIYANNMSEVIAKHITQEDVLGAVLKRIPKEEREAIGLFIKIDNLKASNIEISKGIRNYLVKIGRKDVPSTFKLFRSGVLNSLELKDFKETVSSKWGDFIDDFPVFRKGKYVSPQYTIRRLLRSAPLLAVGVVLTAATITEIINDNIFPQGAFGARKIYEIQKKIDSNDSSFTEAVLFYSDERSSSLVRTNPLHLINALTLALVVKQADEDFNLITKSVQTEMSGKYTKMYEQEVKDNFDIYYNTLVQKVGNGII